MKELLTSVRLTRKGTYAPSPIASGFCLIWMGLGLILNGTFRGLIRVFYAVQLALVWQWMGLRHYDRFTAICAWIITAMCFLAGAVLGKAITFLWSFFLL